MSTAHAQYSVQFTEPPFTVGSTVIGVEGWEAIRVDSTNNDDASLQVAPWDAESTALKLYSTSTLGTSSRVTRIINSFEDKIVSSETPFARIELSLAFEWTGTTSENIDIFFNGGTNTNIANAPFLLRFSPNTTTGGLKYVANASSGGTIDILSVANMKQGALYHFVFDLDYTTSTFDIQVTGVTANDDPFSYQLEDLAFRTGNSTTTVGLGSVSLYNNRGDHMSLYVDGIAVTAIPEPRLGFLLLGTAIYFASTRVRPRKVLRLADQNR